MLRNGIKNLRNINIDKNINSISRIPVRWLKWKFLKTYRELRRSISPPFPVRSVERAARLIDSVPIRFVQATWVNWKPIDLGYLINLFVYETNIRSNELTLPTNIDVLFLAMSASVSSSVMHASTRIVANWYKLMNFSLPSSIVSHNNYRFLHDAEWFSSRDLHNLIGIVRDASKQ